MLRFTICQMIGDMKKMKKRNRVPSCIVIILTISFFVGVTAGVLACELFSEEKVETIIEKEIEFVGVPVYAESVKDVLSERENEQVHENISEIDQENIETREFKLTAYCSCVECCGEYAINRPLDENGEEIVYGSTGERLIAGISVAVDPDVIPYGSTVVINDHEYIAQDCGGAIKGDRIDIYFDNHQDALEFGVQYAEVFVK